jgi:hypothetical protein
MTLEEIITMYRAQAFDNADPYLCSDELLTIYANEAQNEACRRGDLLRDSSSDFCSIAYIANQETVDIDPRIVKIKRAYTDGYPLTDLSVEEMDEISPSWQTDSIRARPTHLISGLTTGVRYLWPRPRDAGTLSLTVQRLPLCKLMNDVDEPEIREEAHMGLVEWMLYRAYSREDAPELYNPQKAAIHEAKFIAEFGRKTSARNEAWMRNGRGVQPDPIA